MRSIKRFSNGRRRGVLLAAALSAALVAGARVTAGRAVQDDAEGWEPPQSAMDQSNPIPATAESIAAGRGVYARHCAACHGDDGKGKGKMSWDLKLRPSDLTDPSVAEEPDGALRWKIATGRRPMPEYRKLISRDDQWRAVLYVKTLSQGTKVASR